MAETLENAIKLLRSGEKRKFSQTFDLIVNLRNIDLKNPENKFTKRVVLPHGRGKPVEVCVIGENGNVTKADIESLNKSKAAAKKLAKQYEFFLCEAPLMPLVGRVLGRYLGPKGKMPELLQPGKNPQAIVEEMKKSVRIKVRDIPTIQVVVGSEEMEDAQVMENATTIIEEIKKSLPAKVQIKSTYLKMTMSKPVRVGI